MSSQNFRVHVLWATYLLLIAGGTGLPETARAQGKAEQVKPYVMLLIDTSGSMIWPVCYSSAFSNSALYGALNGDGSKDCPGKSFPCSPLCSYFGYTLYTGSNCGCNTMNCGNGKADDARLYKVKKGAHSVVSAFGEVTFALSRFANQPYSFTCSASSNSRIGGWTGLACAWGSSSNPHYYPMGTQGNQADVLVGFSDTNQNNILEWMNGCDDYPSVGSCPGSNAPSSGCTLCPSSECRGGCDKELRGAGLTPIAGSLWDLRVNYFNKQVLPNDKKKACRPYKVILLTDGQQSSTCTGNPATEAKNLFTNSAKSIPVHVVGFGDSSLKAGLNAIAAAGGTKTAVVVDNELSLALAMASIVSESLMHEKCNGKDDDCDDSCDEDWPEVAVTGGACNNKHAAKTCTAGVGICKRTGVYVCNSGGTGSVCNVTAGKPNPKGEICNNGLDDNCDGAVDEGCGPTCIPQVEICDGKDNDCDKDIDEGYVSVSCGSNIGECSYGQTKCSGGKVSCSGGQGPTKEICDNKDNNCDTIVDNFSEPCYPAASGCTLATASCTGICKIGIKLCLKGSFGSCLGYQGPKAEVCNGLDDNCNGQIDEGVGQSCINYSTCKSFISCSSCPAAPAEKCDSVDNDCNGKTDDNVAGVGNICGTAIGECTKGKWACKAGKMVCEKGLGPTAEVCDNKDNDCNGKIDDNVAGSGAACGNARGDCKPGQKLCIGGKWVCKGGSGGTAEICDCKDNNCNGQIDEGNPCGSKGKCINCVCAVPCDKTKEFPCPGGTKCGKDGYCIPDKCASAKCKDSEYCLDGKCIPRCQSATCKSHEQCDPKTGLCVDKCASMTCAKEEVCEKGKCVPNPCKGVSCPAGQVCQGGTCVGNPCKTMNCPDGFQCTVTPQGTASCVLRDTRTTRHMLAAGGGGCAMGQLHRAPPWGLLLLGLLALWRNRSRR